MTAIEKSCRTCAGLLCAIIMIVLATAHAAAANLVTDYMAILWAQDSIKIRQQQQSIKAAAAANGTLLSGATVKKCNAVIVAYAQLFSDSTISFARRANVTSADKTIINNSFTGYKSRSLAMLDPNITDQDAITQISNTYDMAKLEINTISSAITIKPATRMKAKTELTVYHDLLGRTLSTTSHSHTALKLKQICGQN